MFGSATLLNGLCRIKGNKFASSMWSIIIALALNSFTKNHGTVSGIMMAGISGGAIYPFIIGVLGDFFELKLGLMTLYL